MIEVPEKHDTFFIYMLISFEDGKEKTSTSLDE